MERSRTLRSGARVSYDSLSKNVLELFGIVWTAYVLIMIKKDLPRREGEAALMRGDKLLGHSVGVTLYRGQG